MIQRKIKTTSSEVTARLFGSYDKNIRRLEEEFGVRISNIQNQSDDGDTVLVEGEDPGVTMAADALTYLWEGSANPSVRVLIMIGNIVFYAAFELFPYFYLLYLDFRVYGSKDRLRKLKVLYGIPCFVILAMLLLNLWTRWFFVIGEDNLYYYGPVHNLVFVPVVLYFLVCLERVRKLSLRLVCLGTLVIVSRILWGIWFRGISSTAFTYTLYLVCTHIYVMDQSIYEENEKAVQRINARPLTK